MTPPSLLRLTQVELRKLTDTRAGYWLMIVIALGAAAIVTLTLIYAPPPEQRFANFFGGSLLPIGLLLPILGILSVSSEFSQRTALTTFALVPRRHRVALAKVFAAVSAGVLSVVASLAIGAGGNLLALAFDGDGDWSIRWLAVLNAVVLQVVNVVMGVAFGMLFLNTPLAIVLSLLLPTIWGVLTETVAGLRPAAQWLELSTTMDPLTTGEVTAGQWARLGVSVAVWVLLPLVLGLVRLLRREVT